MLELIDILALALVVAFSGDELRQISVKHEPLMASCFVLLASIAFAGIMYDLRDGAISWLVPANIAVAAWVTWLIRWRHKC